MDDMNMAAWTDQADTAWRWLLGQNADRYEYYNGLLANHGINLG